MNRKKYLAIIAGIVFGVAGLAFAQKDTPATQAAQPAAQSDAGAPLVACACGHMEAGVTACSQAAPPEAAKRKHAVNAKDKETPTYLEGDPSAPQNHVEYGGGG